MDLRAEHDQTAEEELQAVETEPDSSEDNQEERTYSQTEVEEIIREHLLRFQSLPAQDPQQADVLARREMDLEKKSYLKQKIMEYKAKFNPPSFSGRGVPMIDAKAEYAVDCTEALYGFLDSENMDSFTKAVDAVFNLSEPAAECAYNQGYAAGVKSCEEEPQVPKPDEEVNIIREIFKMGGHL